MFKTAIQSWRGAILLPAVAAGALSLCASSVRAAPVPLPAGETLAGLIALNSTGGVQIGNLVFSDFSYSSTSFSPSNPAPTASQITVTAASGPGTGLSFNSYWDSAAGMNQDSIIRYAVQAVSGGTISTVGLDFNGIAPLPTGANTFASVTETVSSLLIDPNGNPTGQGSTQYGDLSVYNDTSGGPSPDNTDYLTLPSNVNGVYVAKDIAVNSGPGGVSTISFVDNTYQGTSGGPTPEPASIGLLSVMGVSLLARRRRAL